MKKIIFLILISSKIFAQEDNPYELYKANLIGKPAADFKFKDISGKVFLLSDLKGKVVLLNMWFVGCSGCQLEYPGLTHLKSRLKAQKKDDKIVLLSLALDGKESLQNYLKKNPLDFQHMAEAGDISQGTYKALGFPTNIIIDKSGIIRIIKIGGSPQSADDIEYEMLQLLK